MSSTVEKLSSNQIELRFEVEPEVFAKGMDNAYRKMVKRISIPGFRKGHTPRKVIEMHYGESIFYEEAFDDIFPALYQEAIKEHGIEPVDRPELTETNLGSGEQLKFSVKAYVKPDVELGQYKGVKIETHEHEVLDSDVQAELERARERVARNVDVVDRPVGMDDIVNIDYAGFVGENQFEGGTAQGQSLTIGSGQFIPGFEEQLIGKSIGEECEVNVRFPDEYHAEELKGKDATFKVKVNGIQQKEVPDLDDEFAKDVSEHDTLADYKKSIREDLEKKARQQRDAEIENDILEQVVEGSAVDIPEAMIEDQVTSMLRDMELRMMYQGMRLEDYMKYTGQDMESLRAMYREDAERRVKTQLVIEAIRKAEKIEANDEDVDKEMQQYADQNKSSLDDFKKTLSDSDKEYFQNTAALKKTIEFLKDNAVIVVAKEEDVGEEKPGKESSKKADA